MMLHTGDLSFSVRRQTLHSFYTGNTQFLVTTNVLSRAVNGKKVVLVLCFDVDEYKDRINESYLCRVGRCGRFGMIC